MRRQHAVCSVLPRYAESQLMLQPLAIEIATYQLHRPGLLADAGKYVLVHSDRIVGTFERQYEAIAEGYRQFGNVSFLVKQIVA